FSAFGGNDGLVISGDCPLDRNENHDLHAAITVHPGERARLVITSVEPERLGDQSPRPPSAEEVDERFDTTIRWWQRCTANHDPSAPIGLGTMRSAITLKALTNAPTGAIIAAPTTSLPESPGGERNWDYRYSW